MDDLRLPDGTVVPADELRWRFEPSGGPGGQHANRSASRAILRFDVAGSPSLSPEVRRRLLDRLGGRAPGGVVVVSVDAQRSQWRNRLEARRRLAVLLAEALRPQPSPRRLTRPRRAARERRLRAKRRRSEIKRLRRRPEA